jgi:hypothetical protein
MKVSIKSVAVAVVLACAAGNAMAAPPTVPLPQPVPITTLNSNSLSGDPLFAAVWDPLTGQSVVQSLGLTFGQVSVADMTANLNFGALSGFSTTFANQIAAGTTSSLQFQVFSNSYNSVPDANTILTTSRNSIMETKAVDVGAVFGAAASITTWTGRMIGPQDCNKANSCIGADFNDSKSYANTNVFADNLGGTLNGIDASMHTAGFVGTALNFYSVANDTNDPFSSATGNATVTKYAGTWLLSSSGVLTYDVSGGAPVPLPAAVWLLLSGIAGVGTISRRRKNAAVAA